MCAHAVCPGRRLCGALGGGRRHPYKFEFQGRVFDVDQLLNEFAEDILRRRSTPHRLQGHSAAWFLADPGEFFSPCRFSMNFDSQKIQHV